MTILVVGDEGNAQECKLKFGSDFHYLWVKERAQVPSLLKDGIVIFDFQSQNENTEVYAHHAGAVFLDCTTHVIAPVKNSPTKFFGFCGLPTFLNREILEVSVADEASRKDLEEVCARLKTKFSAVKNQVGLITPRVIGMIINEAYFAAQENIASRTDIDLALKLGTNYPYGPFEWTQKIGVSNVFELLEAVYRFTGDERYKVCSLLKHEAAGV